MKILLLGHKGMLGSDLLLKLNMKHEVVGMDKDKIDIVSAEECAKAIKDIAPNIVINAAAYTNVDACETAKEECFAVNAEAVKNIAEACRDKNICIIHFSTDYVFDGTGTQPYKEEDKRNPINVYGESKLASERYLQSLADDYILIRSSWLYGVKGKNFVQTILEKAKTAPMISVVDDQVGSPTYTKDLAAAVDLLIDQNLKGIFHITNRGSCSWYQFAVKILQECGLDDVEVTPIKSDKLPRPAMRPAYSVLSIQKFVSATEKTMQPWQMALQDYLKSIKRLN
ncbi:MAG: dTDP-4-dehydrorhamnose reductase [Deltaproteobacteria bacterium RBG_16_44_11]|nr:MAG: dTDP-4-dehydrorhamnose reductase [Deltaproteobacteria bacterium RBG_16_44_11]